MLPAPKRLSPIKTQSLLYFLKISKMSQNSKWFLEVQQIQYNFETGFSIAKNNLMSLIFRFCQKLDIFFVSGVPT